MRKTMLAATAVALALAAQPAPAQGQRAAEETANPAAAAAIAAIVAIGIGLAIAKHGDRHDHNDDWNNDLHGQPFHPSANVSCYPNQRKCYEHDRYSHRWTRRIFGS